MHISQLLVDFYFDHLTKYWNVKTLFYVTHIWLTLLYEQSSVNSFIYISAAKPINQHIYKWFINCANTPAMSAFEEANLTNCYKI